MLGHQNPDKVSCIYGENPVMRSIMASEQGDRHLADKLERWPRAGVPILTCAAARSMARPRRGSRRRITSALGGNFHVIIKQGEGHFPTGRQDPNPWWIFIVAKSN